MESVLYLLGGLVLLVIGGDYLVKSSVGLSFKLNISKMVIGMTVVSFATSAPELLVSMQAAFDGSPAIAINNVVGSNIANIALVLGVTALIGPIAVDKSFYKLNWPVMVAFSLLLYYFLWNDNQLDRIEGGGLFLGLIIFLIVLLKNSKEEDASDEVDDQLATVGYGKIFLWLAIGGLALFFGSEWLVNGAVDLAKQIGVSKAVISVTMIAIGTSIPELAASVIAALKGEKAISIGNLIGSNIFNIASVLGLTSLVKTIPVTAPQILSNDIFWMLAIAIVLLPLILLPKKFVVTRFKGFLLLAAYMVFIYLAFV
ncbi:calcium/sodium antiporter [Pseudofulvibacter geojedonensis]|uniref:Calcium/sodium antiporter n=1 Tax=Pseudofulvibacter geojedonensis TaxID=1123758 RepID=A0ABW3I2T0_9FLAO